MEQDDVLCQDLEEETMFEDYKSKFMGDVGFLFCGARYWTADEGDNGNVDGGE